MGVQTKGITVDGGTATNSGGVRQDAPVGRYADADGTTEARAAGHRRRQPSGARPRLIVYAFIGTQCGLQVRHRRWG